jgi:hypothetical protein
VGVVVDLMHRLGLGAGEVGELVLGVPLGLKVGHRVLQAMGEDVVGGDGPGRGGRFEKGDVREVELDGPIEDGLPLGLGLVGPAEEQVDRHVLKAGRAKIAESTGNLLGGVGGLDGPKVRRKEGEGPQTHPLDAHLPEGLQGRFPGVARMDLDRDLFHRRHVGALVEGGKHRTDVLPREEGGASPADVDRPDRFLFGVLPGVEAEFPAECGDEAVHVGRLDVDGKALVVGVRGATEGNVEVQAGHGQKWMRWRREERARSPTASTCEFARGPSQRQGTAIRPTARGG